MISCNEDKKQLNAQEIIDKTIEAAGGEIYDHAKIKFSFRKTQYSSQRQNGKYELIRTFTDSVGEVRDVLTNSGFERILNGKKIALRDSISNLYANSVNSVHYFVQLPYGLNDEAVKKELVGESEIEGNKYHEIKVTFNPVGGGVDHGDIYLYWINKRTFTIDYFTYKFYTGEGGIRFRKAYNPRVIEGLRFVDYKNYKIDPWENIDVENVDDLFVSGKLELLSEIKTEDISVEILPSTK